MSLANSTIKDKGFVFENKISVVGIIKQHHEEKKGYEISPKIMYAKGE
jgi:hypothetical protein